MNTGPPSSQPPPVMGEHPIDATTPGPSGLQRVPSGTSDPVASALSMGLRSNTTSKSKKNTTKNKKKEAATTQGKGAALINVAPAAGFGGPQTPIPLSKKGHRIVSAQPSGGSDTATGKKSQASSGTMPSTSTGAAHTGFTVTPAPAPNLQQRSRCKLRSPVYKGTFNRRKLGVPQHRYPHAR